MFSLKIVCMICVKIISTVKVTNHDLYLKKTDASGGSGSPRLGSLCSGFRWCRRFPRLAEPSAILMIIQMIIQIIILMIIWMIIQKLLTISKTCRTICEHDYQDDNDDVGSKSYDDDDDDNNDDDDDGIRNPMEIGWK